MNFSRGKVQILYTYLPGAIFPHEEYGQCLVTTIDLNELPDVNRDALAEVVADAVAQWREPWQNGRYPTVRNQADLERNFTVGEPAYVRFEPYPKTFICQRCRHVSPLSQVRRSQRGPGRCLQQNCDGALVQLLFVQAHNCGRLDEIYLHREGCKIHGPDGIFFDDTGRVTTARWRCERCSGAEVARLRQTPCDCPYSRSGITDPNEKRLKFLPATDPAVFKPQIVPFINFSAANLSRIQTPEARPWVLARIWGLLDKPVIEAYQPQASKAADPGRVADLINELREMNPNHPKVKQWDLEQSAKSKGDIAGSVLRILGGIAPGNIHVTRRMLEQVAVLDSVAGANIASTADRLQRSGDAAQGEQLRATGEWAAERLGIHDMRCLEGFPIGLCAVGYTRIKGDPTQTIINPFPAVKSKTPLYAVVASTEAIYLQLDPLRVISWLERNRLLRVAAVGSAADAWARLYREVPGLATKRGHPQYNDPAASAVRTLLHTISHVLLRHIEWSGYGAKSIGEYLMPEGLAFVSYANRYTDTKVGGLLTLFEQGLRRWLETAYQEGNDCVLDPFCADEGGACVGCLHREFNCTEFNRELSRSVLFGGQVAQRGAAPLPFGPQIEGYWIKS